MQMQPKEPSKIFAIKLTILKKTSWINETLIRNSNTKKN